MSANPFRVGVVGAGFWTRFQLAAWREIEGIELVGITNRTPGKADDLAQEFAVHAVYSDLETMLTETEVDVVDIITAVETHRPLSD